MRRMVLLALIAIGGCGGSSGGKVDPGALDACLVWLNGVCGLAFTCVDTAAQDATFQARYGATQDACLDKLLARCQSNQTGDVFGPSCGPGKVVNQTAVEACRTNFQGMNCSEWTASPAGGCDGICGAPSGPGTGGTSGGGGAGGGSGGPATYVDYCHAAASVTCNKGVECNPTSGVTVAQCLAVLDAYCADAVCTTTYNRTAGASCLAAGQAATCVEFMNGTTPPVCDSVCPLPP